MLQYHDWLVQENINSEWLFPSIDHYDCHITEKQFYKVMERVGDLLGINYLGTHPMRKTGAYRVYTQSNYNISLVMHLLHHSSEYMTLTYLGLNQDSRKTMLDQMALLSRLWTGFFDTARCRYTEKFSKPRFQPKMA